MTREGRATPGQTELWSAAGACLRRGSSPGCEVSYASSSQVGLGTHQFLEGKKRGVQDGSRQDRNVCEASKHSLTEEYDVVFWPASPKDDPIADKRGDTATYPCSDPQPCRTHRFEYERYASQRAGVTDRRARASSQAKRTRISHKNRRGSSRGPGQVTAGELWPALRPGRSIASHRVLGRNKKGP